MLYLTLQRQQPNAHATLGRLSCNMGVCCTLEPGTDFTKGRIPAGDYDVILTWSPKFKRAMPLVNNVPGFDGIRIHPGNTDADTEGCILVGTWAELARIDASDIAFGRVYDWISSTIQRGEGVRLTIVEAPEVNAA